MLHIIRMLVITLKNVAETMIISNIDERARMARGMGRSNQVREKIVEPLKEKPKSIIVGRMKQAEEKWMVHMEKKVILVDQNEGAVRD